MNKELQDKAWSVLPKEFKEEVKKMFQKDINTCNNMNQAMRCILVDIFGLHNLTSDAEGEEMLHIKRSEVTSRYEAYSKESANVKNNEPYLQFCEGRLNVLTNLFGSKCLPDDTKDDTKEPKPAVRTFKVDVLAYHKISSQSTGMPRASHLTSHSRNSLPPGIRGLSIRSFT